MRKKIDKVDLTAALVVSAFIYANMWVVAVIFALGYISVSQIEKELRAQKKRKEQDLSLCRILSEDLYYGK